jgi:hypothetical protein
MPKLQIVTAGIIPQRRRWDLVHTSAPVPWRLLGNHPAEPSSLLANTFSTSRERAPALLADYDSYVRAFVIGIQVAGEREELRYAASVGASSVFSVGQEVRVQYQKRGIPPLWRRCTSRT